MTDQPDLIPFADTPLGIEIDRIAAGEPWCADYVAGLQFYDYDGDDGLDGRVRPMPGDRLHLVRAPENVYDPNAIEVWWRNEYRLGHVPRYTAGIVAPLLDAGTPLRAYVWDGGDGGAWSVDMLLIGEAVRSSHAKWIEHEAAKAEYEVDQAIYWRRASPRATTNGNTFQHEQRRRRTDRLAQAVAVFSTMPWVPVLPAVGERVFADQIADVLDCSKPTAWRLINRAGIPKVVKKSGYYSYADRITVSEKLVEICIEHCSRPRRMSAAVIKDRAA